jgi:hypothetical protein
MVIALILVTYIPALTVVPPPDRRARVAQLGERVQAAARKARAVQQVTLPDGTELELAECDAISDSLAKAECVGVFTAVTTCREQAGPNSPCETRLLQEYQDSRGGAGGGGDDWDLGDDDDDDDSWATEADAGAAGDDTGDEDTGDGEDTGGAEDTGDDTEDTDEPAGADGGP